jgi:hypothetical protein
MRRRASWTGPARCSRPPSRCARDYATAHENLGDIYLQMSVDAYQRAARLQPGNRAAGSKLALTRELLAKTRAVP